MADSIKARIRHAVNKVIRPLGAQLVRSDRSFEMDGLLERAAARGVKIRTWVDVGASDGSWSLVAQRHFPDSKFLLFEALEERRPELDRLARSLGFIPLTAAAGASPGTIEFSVADNLDGSGIASPGAEGTRSVPVATIRDSVAAHSLEGPYGIKLDTHGFEIPILEGAGSILDQAALLVIEAYNFQLTSSSLRFHELCAWLEARGFRCCDLADPMRRPRDGLLWQMDLAFAPASSPVFASNRYS